MGRTRQRRRHAPSHYGIVHPPGLGLYPIAYMAPF
jgi:hypothetical protein